MLIISVFCDVLVGNIMWLLIRLLMLFCVCVGEEENRGVVSSSVLIISVECISGCRLCVGWWVYLLVCCCFILVGC